jgi:alcohol dehydrogenase class IV
MDDLSESEVRRMSLFAALRVPGEILFGEGQSRTVGLVAAKHGSRALICTDARFANTQAFADILESVGSAGLRFHVHDETQPDVPYESVATCVGKARSFQPDLVIGVGGGSCLDMAKCAALITAHGGALQDYYGEFKVPGPGLPVIAVPTTAGTGSEVTPVAVISDASRALKVGISSPHLIPVAAICDPLLTLTCPPSLTAIAGADALTHAIEAFTAARRGTDPKLPQEHVFIGKSALSDHFAMLAVRLIGRSLERAYADGSDRGARADVMMGALAAGCAFGTAGTAAAHAIQYPIGALTNTPHGLGVATMLPYVMAYNKASCTAEMAAIAEALGLEVSGLSEGRRADLAVDGVTRLFARIGIAPTLAALGLPEEKIDWTAEQAIGIQRLIKNNPRPIEVADMGRLIRAAYDGNLSAAA